MKLYTKTGDDGTTGLFGGQRVAKEDPRVEAYGSVDETNATIGLARSFEPAAEIDAVLERVQNELFVLGAELACVPGKESRLRLALIDAENVAHLEQDIDRAEAALPPLKHFVLPGGSRAAAALHTARAVCRRAERCCWTAHRTSPLRPELLIYLNRLSDLLFSLSRRANLEAQLEDRLWKPRTSPT